MTKSKVRKGKRYRASVAAKKKAYIKRRKPFQHKVSIYKAALEELEPSVRVDEQLLTAAAKACGPAIYIKNAAVVATSRKSELARVKKNFLIKRLGQKDTPKLDKVIDEVVEVFGSSHPRKYRAIFYYLLAKKLGVQENLINPINSTKSTKEFRSSLITFGENLIEEQEDIDPEIMQALESDFFALL